MIIASEAILGTASVFTWDSEVFFVRLMQVQHRLLPEFPEKCLSNARVEAISRALHNIACFIIALVVQPIGILGRYNRVQPRILMPKGEGRILTCVAVLAKKDVCREVGHHVARCWSLVSAIIVLQVIRTRFTSKLYHSSPLMKKR